MEFFNFINLPETVIGIFLGIGLSAAAGFRVFVPLFMVSLAVHFGNGIIPISETWLWVGDWPAIIALGAATIIEIFGYYFPFIDNILDTIAIPLATLSGTLLMASQLGGFDYPVVSWALAIIAGGGTAAAIKSTTAGTRGVSSASTLGTGNFAIATAETGAATTLGLLSIFSPIIAIILVIIILIGMYKLIRVMRNKIKT